MSNSQTLKDPLEYLCNIMEDLTKFEHHEYKLTNDDKQELKTLFERIIKLNKSDRFLAVRLIERYSNLIFSISIHYLSNPTSNEDILLSIANLIEECFFYNDDNDIYSNNVFLKNLECYYLIVQKLNYSIDDISLLKTVFSMNYLYPKYNEVMSLTIDFYLNSYGKEIFNQLACYTIESINNHNYVEFNFKEHLLKIMNHPINFPGLYDKKSIFAQLVKKLTEIYKNTNFDDLIHTIFTTSDDRQLFQVSFMSIGLYEKQMSKLSK